MLVQETTPCLGLGLTLFILGNLVVEAARARRGEQRQAVALKSLYSKYKAWASLNDVRDTLPEWTEANLHLDDAIYVSGKAAAARKAVAWAWRLVQEIHDESQRSNLMLGAAQGPALLSVCLIFSCLRWTGAQRAKGAA